MFIYFPKTINGCLHVLQISINTLWKTPITALIFACWYIFSLGNISIKAAVIKGFIYKCLLYYWDTSSSERNCLGWSYTFTITIWDILNKNIHTKMIVKKKVFYTIINSLFKLGGKFLFYFIGFRKDLTSLSTVWIRPCKPPALVQSLELHYIQITKCKKILFFFTKNRK